MFLQVSKCVHAHDQDDSNSSTPFHHSEQNGYYTHVAYTFTFTCTCTCSRTVAKNQDVSTVDTSMQTKLRS